MRRDCCTRRHDRTTLGPRGATRWVRGGIVDADTKSAEIGFQRVNSRRGVSSIPAETRSIEVEEDQPLLFPSVDPYLSFFPLLLFSCIIQFLFSLYFHTRADRVMSNMVLETVGGREKIARDGAIGTIMLEVGKREAVRRVDDDDADSPLASRAKHENRVGKHVWRA